MFDTKLENYKILYEFLKEEAQTAHGHLPFHLSGNAKDDEITFSLWNESKPYKDYVALCFKRDKAKRMFINKMNIFLKEQTQASAGFQIDYPPSLDDELK